MERLPDFMEVRNILLNFLTLLLAHGNEDVRKSLALGWKFGRITNFALVGALAHVISVLDLPLFHGQLR